MRTIGNMAFHSKILTSAIIISVAYRQAMIIWRSCAALLVGCYKRLLSSSVSDLITVAVGLITVAVARVINVLHQLLILYE